MANVNAVAAVCEAIRWILDSTIDADIADLRLGGPRPVFSVVNSQKFTTLPANNTVTVMVYRILPNLSHRTPPGRLLSNGRRQRTRLPIDLHLLVTVWATSPSTQNKLLAWTMRTLEDYPTLPPSLLNMEYARTFGQDEAVELAISELTLEETLSLWEKVSRSETPFQVSIPYVARAIFLESKREELAGDLVQIRDFDFQEIVSDGSAVGNDDDAP